jgi:hypothetical protein
LVDGQSPNLFHVLNRPRLSLWIQPQFSVLPKGFYGYLAEDPEASAIFNAAMAAKAHGFLAMRPVEARVPLTTDFGPRKQSPGDAPIVRKSGDGFRGFLGHPSLQGGPRDAKTPCGFTDGQSSHLGEAFWIESASRTT